MHLLLAFMLLPLFLSAATGNPKACGPEEHLVSAHHRRAYTRGDGTLVRATDVVAHCRKNPSGYHQWISKLKSDKPSWSPKAGKIANWTTEEIERVLEALEEIP